MQLQRKSEHLLGLGQRRRGSEAIAAEFSGGVRAADVADSQARARHVR